MWDDDYDLENEDWCCLDDDIWIAATNDDVDQVQSILESPIYLSPFILTSTPLRYGIGVEKGEDRSTVIQAAVEHGAERVFKLLKNHPWWGWDYRSPIAEENLLFSLVDGGKVECDPDSVAFILDQLIQSGVSPLENNKTGERALERAAQIASFSKIDYFGWMWTRLSFEDRTALTQEDLDRLLKASFMAFPKSPTGYSLNDFNEERWTSQIECLIEAGASLSNIGSGLLSLVWNLDDGTLRSSRKFIVGWLEQHLDFLPVNSLQVILNTMPRTVLSDHRMTWAQIILDHQKAEANPYLFTKYLSKLINQIENFDIFDDEVVRKKGEPVMMLLDSKNLKEKDLKLLNKRAVSLVRGQWEMELREQLWTCVLDQSPEMKERLGRHYGLDCIESYEECCRWLELLKPEERNLLKEMMTLELELIEVKNKDSSNVSSSRPKLRF